MTLAALAEFDATIASAILANAVLQSKAADDEPSRLNIGGRNFSHETASVLAEVRQMLGLAPDDESASSMARIDDFIGRALDDLVRPHDGGKSALDRAGQLGRLPSSMFELRVDQRFSAVFDQFGFRKKNLQAIIQKAVSVQHLLPELKIPKSFSVFLRLETLKGVDHQHWTVLQTMRTGRELLACSAWRVFDSEVDLSNAKDPLDVLRCFVLRYGANIKFGSQYGKFIYEEHTPAPDKLISSNLHFSVENQPKDFFLQGTGGPASNSRLLVHGPFYCIDMGAYKKDLRAHGFRC